MFVEERQALIIEELHQKGKVKVKELSERFHVSEDLIRKDLSALESKGLLKKAYGGAVLGRENLHRKLASERKDMHMEKKKIIAKEIVSLIENGDVIFFDISTINIEAAKCLIESDKHPTVVTNMLEVVAILRNSNLTVVFIGGEFDYGKDGFVGTLAMEQIKKFRFDLSFIGVVGVDIHENSVYTYMANDGETKKAILNSSKHAYMICESDKFMEIGNFCYAQADEFTGVVTDQSIEKETIDVLQQMQLNVITPKK